VEIKIQFRRAIMTIKSKTFYVGDKGMGDIKSDNNALMCIPNKDSIFRNEITISWKEERKAEVTESQIDEALTSAFVSMKEKYKEFSFITTEYRNLIKEQIFKDVK
jgi:hypothetical protein